MRLVSVSSEDGDRAGALFGDRVADVGDLLRLEHRVSMREVFAGGTAVLEALLRADLTGVELVPLDGLMLGPPLRNPGKVVAIGLNYADHAAEGKVAVPSEPLVFAKFPSAIIGPGDPIRWDRSLTDAVDYEAELAVVIGQTARRIDPATALDHVFGYMCLNDVSARDLQFGDGQWVRGKSLDTFCPIGPWLVTADEIPDPQALRISCSVSGQMLQEASTADMFFGVAELIARLSAAFTLEPGDIIATGTPPGVGWFRDPPKLLRDGDEVVVSIERIGELRNPVVVTGTRREATG